MKRERKGWWLWALAVGVLLLGTLGSPAQDAAAAAAPAPLDEVKTGVSLTQTSLNIVWTLVAAFLVFFMQAGLRWWRPD
jgi:polyferredoxin